MVLLLLLLLFVVLCYRESNYIVFLNCEQTTEKFPLFFSNHGTKYLPTLERVLLPLLGKFT